MPTTSPSIRAQVGHALADRLRTVTAANGYDADIKQVYYDSIPLGLELTPEQLPAIFVLDEGSSVEHDKGVLDVARAYRLQLVHSQVPDDTMDELLRAVAKAIWANSPTAERVDGWRDMHQRIYQVTLDGDATDVHAIDENRIATMRLIVQYRTKPFDL